MARWKWIVIEKWYNRWLRFLNMFFPGRIYIARGPLALWGFLQHLSAKFKWRPKKVLLSEQGPRHWAIWQIRRWLLHYVHEKFRWGPKVATFRTKIIHPSYTFKLVGKNWIKEVCRAPWSSISFIVNCCCTRVLLYAKMLKETENEETRLFCQILSLVAFRLRGPGPLGHSLATPMILR